MDAYNQLPKPRRRDHRGGADLCSLSVSLKIVTPVLGGGARVRSDDDVNPIRVPSIRGQLRFWWRALFASLYATPGQLYQAETRFWGRAADEHGGRSPVSITLETLDQGIRDNQDINLGDKASYALWPARGTQWLPTASRLSGVRFRLLLIAPSSSEDTLRAVVRAWILFGGYGSRTRRGLGSLAVADDKEDWLPADVTRESIKRAFGSDIFENRHSAITTCPSLNGASLYAGDPVKNADEAWLVALGWLREFRQGTEGGVGNRAREPGEQPNRPSISNWPEADAVRVLTGKTKAHRPRYWKEPTWPRAGFGLPIVGRFQNKARDGKTKIDEPEGFELRLRTENKIKDRLASPLVLKALQVANGEFVPVALWLSRAMPADAEVVGLYKQKFIDKSAVPFSKFLPSDYSPQFSALRDKADLRQAFLDWLRDRCHASVVAP